MINVKMQSNKPSDLHKLSPKIAVIGVGGAGGNAVNNMISSNLEGCEFLACNTDAQALQGSLSQSRIQLGVNITGGLGAGSKPEVGRAAAEESLEEVLRYLDGANMAFVTAGMGGGTGTGAAPVIAKACREQGILTVGVVTKPFHFEGAHRMEQAERGIAEMQQYVDTLIVIPNQNLFRIANEKTTFSEAFKMADTVLQSGVRGVTDLMVRPGLVNLDFADIKTAMQQMGKAMMGTGEASGDKRAIQAAEAAINNPLLDDVSMKGAHGVIINVTGGYDMTLFEADEACNRIRDEVDPSANIIFGATFDETMDGKMRVSIVATGIEREVGKNKIFSGGTGGGGGGLRTDGRTPGQLLDRSPTSAQPAAPAAAPAASSPMVSVPADRTAASMGQRDIGMYATGRETVRNLKAPAPISETVRQQYQQPSAPDIFSTGRKIQEQMAEISSAPDMFSQQQEFPVYGDRPQYGHAPQASTPQQESGLRGTTYKDAFIPPRPMEADIAIPENGIGSHISSFHGAHVESRNAGEPVSSLRLNAPAGAPSRNAGIPQPQQRKSPSLFERITGSVQQHLESFRDDGDMVKPRPMQEQPTPYQPVGGVVPPRHAVGGGSPAQAAMNMSSPAAKPVSKQDEDLDIPAFLRRQAN